MAKNDLFTWLILGGLGLLALIFGGKMLTKQAPPPPLPTRQFMDTSQFEIQNIPIETFPSPYDTPNEGPTGKFDYGSVANSMYTKKPGCGCGK